MSDAAVSGPRLLQRLAAPSPRVAAVTMAGLLGVGVLTRVYLLHSSTGQEGNLEVAAHAASVATGQHALHVYAEVAWPYPAGLLPLLAILHYLADWGLSFRDTFAAANGVADIAIAVIVFRHFVRREQLVRAVAAGCLVALGWPFVFDTAMMNQADSVSCLPAVAAVVLWHRDVERRSWYSGLLLGLATACKSPFGFLALALLPTARGWREGARTAGLTIAVPLLMTAPYLVADFHNVVHSISANHGTLGTGGLTLLLQPALQRDWLSEVVFPTSINAELISRQQLFVIGFIAPIGLLLWHRRVDVLRAAAIISLVVWVTNVDQNLRYLVWLIPFLLLDDQLGAATIVQVLGALPGLQFMVAASSRIAGDAYRPLVELVAAYLAALLLYLCVRLPSPTREPRAGAATSRPAT